MVAASVRSPGDFVHGHNIRPAARGVITGEDENAGTDPVGPGVAVGRWVATQDSVLRSSTDLKTLFAT
mgnify:FL=1